MPLTSRGFLARRREPVDAAMTSVIADSTPISAVNDGGIVNVVNDVYIYTQHGPVVIETPIVPASAFEAFSEIAKSVVNPAIKAYLWTPIPIVKSEPAIQPCPIGRGPKKSNFRSQHPGAGHPVIVLVVVAPGPVAWRPEITVAGAERLLIKRDRRRTESHRDENLAKRSRRNDQHCECEEYCANPANQHGAPFLRQSFGVSVRPALRGRVDSD
jgi:hypothetical protein